MSWILNATTLPLNAMLGLTTISKLKIQRMDLLCNHITKYVEKDVVHKYLCLAFARQENVSGKRYSEERKLLTC